MKNFYEVFKHRLIYVYAIPDAAHRGLLKIGETTISTDLPVKKISPNSSELNAAANKRIKDCTNTAAIVFKLLHTELAVTDDGKKSFRDSDVHELLKNSGIKSEQLEGTTAREWFRLDLPTAIQAIKAVKRNDKFLVGLKSKKFRAEIILRPEQEIAVKKTINYFQRGGDEFLWNAKMRFGKTLCALEVVQAMNFAKTIIVTHRPVVDAGWFDDFKKVFDGNEDFIYGQKGTDVKDLLASKKNFVYFASIQDLRGSKKVGGKFDKNDKVFSTQWDCVIVDEAHEGTQTALGDAVIKKLVKKKTKFLALSGTPFNLLKNFSPESIYTWDYVMEQHAKNLWATEHGDDPNPYEDLPTMNIYTYNLGELLGKKFSDDEDIIFSFKEFFRTDDAGNFVHESDVESFLNLLVKPDDSNYPFSRPEFRDMFRHTLWRVPGVKAGKALSQMLQRHNVFRHFKIVNVAGEGDDDAESDDALKLVQDAIKKHERTITISCGKLTTGVTVPQWTAVLMLAGNTSFTSAASYLQTIFRVQTPCNENGVSKQNCYVFDFAPYRALRMLAASIKVSVRAGKTTDDERKTLDDLLKFCPVIAVEGSEMNPLDADKLLQRIKSAQAERIVQNGFDDNNLYSDILRDLTDVDWKKFDKLKKIVGVTKKKSGDIVINDQGIDEGDGGPSTKSQRTPEQKENDRKNKVKRDAISILTGISIRMPLLIYGANVDFKKDFTIDMFLNKDVVDDASWTEFMPAGVTREFFQDFMQYYDRDVFIEAGRRVRNLAKAADELTPTERVKAIAELFSTFKNPDKETVLTPWRVVNLHMTEVFGGWNFFAEDNPPQFVPTEIFRPNKKILEINSKTGLYPLFVAYSIFRARLDPLGGEKISLEAQQKIWDKVINENVFVICKTPMAKTITRRTLLGYRGGNVNAHCFDDLINTLKNKPKQFVDRVTNKNFWNKGSGKMFFDAVVGNPPYQNLTVNTSDEPIYNHFIEASQKLSDKVSLIHPARCLFNAGKTPKDFNQWLLTNPHMKVVRYEADSTEFFPTSDIKGGIAITYYDAKKIIGPIGTSGTFFAFDELKSIHQKVFVADKNFRSLNEIIFTTGIFRFTEAFSKNNPVAAKILKDSSVDFLTTNIFDKMPEIFFDAKPDNRHEYAQIYGLTKLQRVYKWIRRDFITDHETFDKFKVFLPKSNGSGEFGETLSSPIVVGKKTGCTQTFLTFGAFDTRDEAEACLKYIKTKFARAMLGILKVTHHNPAATWAKVPMQNFTASSDIDWTKSVAQIDAELYDKYGLTDAEKNFIESHVKEMT